MGERNKIAMEGLTNCRIMSYCKTDPHEDDEALNRRLALNAMIFGELRWFLKKKLERGDKVQTSQSKFWGKRSKKEWGAITDFYDPDDAADSCEEVKRKELKKFLAEKKTKVLWAKCKIDDWTNCEIMSFDRVNSRRRMATRQYSGRRDSPVMLRLLKEIRAAQD